jgi:hypothetical protein
VKPCVYCRWIRLALEIQSSTCAHLASMHIVRSPVNGSEQRIQDRCDTARRIGECGADGKFWQPRQIGRGLSMPALFTRMLIRAAAVKCDERPAKLRLSAIYQQAYPQICPPCDV